MIGIDVYEWSDAFWTRDCGVYRHSAQDGKPGLYRVTMLPESYRTSRFFAAPSALPNASANAVVDDFGNLVRVQ